MWIKVLKDHDHWPSPRRMQSFKAGTEQSVKRETGDAAIKEGWGEEIEAPASQNAAEAPSPVPADTKAKK